MLQWQVQGVKPATPEQMVNYVRRNWPSADELHAHRKANARFEAEDALEAHFSNAIRDPSS